MSESNGVVGKIGQKRVSAADLVLMLGILERSAREAREMFSMSAVFAVDAQRPAILAPGEQISPQQRAAALAQQTAAAAQNSLADFRRFSAELFALIDSQPPTKI